MCLRAASKINSIFAINLIEYKLKRGRPSAESPAEHLLVVGLLNRIGGIRLQVQK